jgi:type IV pilus assembly protein PilB
MEDKRKKPIGELLLEAGLIDEHQLKAALAYQRKWGGRLGVNLVTLRFITEDKLLRFLSSYFKIPFVNFEKISISPMVINSVPLEMAKQYNVIPLAIRSEGGKQYIFVATSDPTNLDAFDAIQFKTGMKVKSVLATDSAITQAIGQYFQQAGSALSPQQPQISQKEALQLEEEITKAGKIDFIEQSSLGTKPAAPEAEEEMIIFTGGEEHHLAIDTEGGGGGPLAEIKADPAQLAQLALALSELLIEKKLITPEELKKKIKPKA